MTTASHRRYLQPISSQNRRSEPDDIAESSSTPSSIIAWAWYVDGVRKPAETSAWRHTWPTPEKALYMRKISAWVAIVAVPTMVAGIYGMNFDNMPELHWRYGYFALLGVMLLIMVTLYLGFKRNHWL